MAIVEVIKYNGEPDVFAWKYPSEELGTWTQLIVNESQEAILLKGGKAYDVFESGRHTLSTANIPILNGIINLPFGGRSPFTAEVWYINKLFSLDIIWGTATPIQIQDPKYGVLVQLRANGMFGIQIEDAQKFLVKLVGTMPIFDKKTLIQYFRGLYITKVKDAISSYVVHKKISVVEINAFIDELSEHMKERIEPTMAEYGIKLAHFYVNDISIQENDPGVRQLKAALAKKAEMNIIGYSYQQERSFDTLEGAAHNEGSMSGSLMGAGMGLGMGVNLGNAVGNAFEAMTQEMNTTKGDTKDCPKCHSVLAIGQRFCGTCGYDTTQVQEHEANTKAIICSQCGTALGANSKFCPECGKKYNPCKECGADMPDGMASCPECGAALPQACPNCGHEVPNHVKFCPECGYSLAKKCASCGTVVQGNMKFCMECGQKL